MGLAEQAALVVKLSLKDELSRGVAGARGALKGLDGAFSNTQRSLETTARNVKRGALLIGGAIVAGLAFAVREAAGFQAKMTESLAIMGDVTVEMRDKLERAARDVAKTTKFSAQEAAEAYFFLASAGLDAEQQLAAMPKVAAFAQAGMFDLATATDLLTDAQSALGLSSKDAAENLENMTKLGDVLVKANTLANASVEQFSQSLTNKAGAAMRKFGIETEDGVAVLATWADSGLKGQTAGNAFAAMLEGLAIAAVKNRTAFEKYNVEIFDTEGNMLDMVSITENLTRAFAGMSDEQRTAAFRQLGLNRRVGDGVTLLLDQTEKTRDYRDELRKAGGTMDEVAAKQLDNLSAQFGLFKDNVKDAGIVIGTALLPGLTRVTRKLTEMIRENGPAIERFAKRLGEAFDSIFSDKNIEEGVGALAAKFGEFIGWLERADIEGGLRQGLSFLRDLPWGTIAEGMKITGQAVGLIIGEFRKLPPDMQKILIGALALNKATGGLVTSVFKDITGIALRSLTTINAGNVTVLGKSVVGPGGAGGAGAAGGLGAAAAGAAIGGVAVAVADEHVAGQVREFRSTLQEQYQGLSEQGREQADEMRDIAEHTSNFLNLITPFNAVAAELSGVRNDIDSLDRSTQANLVRQHSLLENPPPIALTPGTTSALTGPSEAQRDETRLFHQSYNTSIAQQIAALDANRDGVVSMKEVLAERLGVSIEELRGIKSKEEQVAERLGISIDELRGAKDAALLTAERLATGNERLGTIIGKSAEQNAELDRIRNASVNMKAALDRKNFNPTINVPVRVNTTVTMSARAVAQQTARFWQQAAPRTR